MTFTDNVTFNGDINDIIGIKQVRRRLLFERVLQQNYRIEIVDEKTIKIVLLDDDT